MGSERSVRNPPGQPDLSVSLPAEAPLGRIVDIDLLAPYVLLDRLGVLNYVLADPYLLLGHRPLLHHDLFLGNGDAYLVVSDLGLGSLAHYRNALDGDLLVAGRYLHALAVGAHALTDVEGAGLALSCSGPELLLGPLDPELVLVVQVAAGLGDAL